MQMVDPRRPMITDEHGAVPGWYDYREFWRRAIESAPPGSTLIEIGVFCGKSLIDISRMAKEANKGLKIVGIDTFGGSEEHHFLTHAPDGILAREAWVNLRNAGELDNVFLLTSDSLRAAALFPDFSVWAVFIDAAHDEQSVTNDIALWLGKVSPGGMLGGHDYHTFDGVRSAVDKRFPGIIVPRDQSWWEVSPQATKRASVLVTVLTYSGQVGGYVFNYCNRLHAQMFNHPHISKLDISFETGYPTTCVRNRILKRAVDDGYDYCLMLDDDMYPDLLLDLDKSAAPFLPSALTFAVNHDGPCVIAAPYCSGPPLQEVLVFLNRIVVPDMPDIGGSKLDKFTRDEAATREGIERVNGLATGCMLIDTRCASILPPPWFDYEYSDEYETRTVSTEDTVFSRNLDALGVPQYCQWSSWAGHDKRYLTGKPNPSPIDRIPKSILKYAIAQVRDGNNKG